MSALSEFKHNRAAIRARLEDRLNAAIGAIKGNYRADVRLGEQRTDKIYIHEDTYWRHIEAYTNPTAPTVLNNAIN